MPESTWACAGLGAACSGMGLLLGGNLAFQYCLLRDPDCSFHAVQGTRKVLQRGYGDLHKSTANCASSVLCCQSLIFLQCCNSLRSGIANLRQIKGYVEAIAENDKFIENQQSRRNT